MTTTRAAAHRPLLSSESGEEGKYLSSDGPNYQQGPVLWDDGVVRATPSRSTGRTQPPKLLWDDDDDDDMPMPPLSCASAVTREGHVAGDGKIEEVDQCGLRNASSSAMVPQVSRAAPRNATHSRLAVPRWNDDAHPAEPSSKQQGLGDMAARIEAKRAMQCGSQHERVSATSLHSESQSISCSGASQQPPRSLPSAVLSLSEATRAQLQAAAHDLD